MHRRSPTRTLAAAVAGLLAVGTAACGDDDGTAADTEESRAEEAATTATTAEAPVTTAGGAADHMATDSVVVAQDFAFQVPGPVTPGARITFENRDAAPHTMTADEGAAFDSGRVAGGSTGAVTAPSEPGEYAFHCEVHPRMQATLTVQ
jgi:plastocyanin